MEEVRIPWKRRPSVTSDRTSSYQCPFPVSCRPSMPKTALLQQPKLSKDCGQFLTRPTPILSVWSLLASLWRSCWLTPLALQAPSLLLNSVEEREYLGCLGKVVGWLKRSQSLGSLGAAVGAVGVCWAELEVVVLMCLCILSPESNCILNLPLQAGKLPVCCPCPHTVSDSAGNIALATLSLLICF